MRVARATAPLTALAVTLLSAASLANGRFPSAGQIAFDPRDPRHLTIRATFGLLETRDRGRTFDFVCESALMLGVEEDPMLAFTGSGRLVVATFGGMLTSDDGCSFAFVPELEGEIVRDLASSAAAPDRLVAFRLFGLGGGFYRSSLLRSDDAGLSFTVFPPLPEELLPLTVDLAAADPERVFLTARRGSEDGYDSVLLRSDDGGETFRSEPIPGTSGQHLAYIAAVHPSDRDRLWIRVDDPDGTIVLETRDAGATFDERFAGRGLLPGFALSPDGTELAVGGLSDGLWLLDADTGTSRRGADVWPSCLGWNDDGLWACADAANSGFSIGRSGDGGRSFEALLAFRDLCGTSRCGAGSDVAELCPHDWQGVAPTLAASCELPDAGSDAGAERAREPPAARGGCRLSPTPGHRRAAPSWLLAALALFTVRAARWRRARAGGKEFSPSPPGSPSNSKSAGGGGCRSSRRARPAPARSS